MKKLYLAIFILLPLLTIAQEDESFKKRALENAEIDILTSFYSQSGQNASVTGGIGNEALIDGASDIVISVPTSMDGVFTLSATVSVYSSASSGNLDPFSDEEDEDDHFTPGPKFGSPWVASSGASETDVWFSGSIGYSHYSDSRNSIYSANINFASEYDYTSTGAGISYVGLFNEKNTEFSIGLNTFFDFWDPETPIELRKYISQGGNTTSGYFSGTSILDSNGNPTVKTSANTWKANKNNLVETENRNTFTISIGFSQILSENLQFGIFSDLTYQNGWLSNPMQRVYFADVADYYVGNANSIPNYTQKSNKDVFMLADDIERLPQNRLKLPIGIRLNYFINEYLVANTYYRFYTDDWGLKSHTVNLELPIKFAEKYTLYPSVRYYVQSAADYFGEFNQLLSSQSYYTSDFDLSKFSAMQYGIGFKYNDLLSENHIWRFVFKNFGVDYKFYHRNNSFQAHIISMGVKIAFE